MMKNKNIIALFTSAIAVSVLSGCGNLSNVNENGTTDNPVWPNIEDTTINYNGSQHGSWPNWDNVRLIQPGMNKAQIYELIGRPHFNEGLFGVREWNYVFNYRQAGERKVCQFKLLFDKDMNTNAMLWKPKECSHQYELSGDLLFDFDSAKLTKEGRETIKNISMELKQQHVKSLVIDGYTDYLGSESYNLALSEARGYAVKSYMVKLGFPAQNITVNGLGEKYPVVTCKKSNDLKALKECLRPNRRVNISEK